MHDPHAFLTNLALVLCVAAVTTVLFQRLRQPVVLGYIMAGLVIGPSVGPSLHLPLTADRPMVQTLSELGVILVMFSLGLEFSLRRLFRRGIRVAVVAAIEVSLMIWLGAETARLFDFATPEALLTGAAVCISSTTIIAKTFEDHQVAPRIKEIVFGVLIFEDLIAILLLAVLPPVVSGGQSSAQTVETVGLLASTTVRLVVFLVLVLIAGMLVVPRAMRFVVRLGRAETTLVASIGVCFALAVLVQSFGYSVALGAFLAGSLVSESGTGHRVEVLVKPIRDMFAAIFFVSVGMLIEPADVVANWPAVLALTGVVIAGKIIAISLAAFLTGNPLHVAVQSGMTLAQIGEFSFILVGLGLTLRVVRPFLFPVVVAVSFITTLTTPWLVRISARAAAGLHERLPGALQTFTSLYGTWLERLLATKPTGSGRGRRIRRRVTLLFLDAGLLAALVIGASLASGKVIGWLTGRFGMGPVVARWVFAAGSIAAALPFVLGVIRLSRGVGLALAELALPHAKGQLDLAAAPRRAFVVTLQLGVVLAVGAPLLVLTQPFLPPLRGAAVLFLGLCILGVGFWRSATNLEGHVRAGAQVIVEVLAAQGRTDRDTGTHEIPKDLSVVEQSLPGLGAPTPVQVAPESGAVGKTLGELNLRGLTGATVLAITREGTSVTVPTAGERLQAHDVLALAGTREAVEAARKLLA